MAINTFNMRVNRAKAVDYLITDARASVGRFFIKKPRYTYDWTVFFQPLWIEAWIGLVAFSLVIPFLIAIVIFFRKI